MKTLFFQTRMIPELEMSLPVVSMPLIYRQFQAITSHT
jgi:hypothetical protein